MQLSVAITVLIAGLKSGHYAWSPLKPGSEYDASRRRVVDATQEPAKIEWISISLRCVALTTCRLLASYSEPGLRLCKEAMPEMRGCDF